MLRHQRTNQRRRQPGGRRRRAGSERHRSERLRWLAERREQHRGDGSEENTTDQESNESDTENNESKDGDPEGNETEEDGESNESDGSTRPSDPTETITLKDHGADIVDSPEEDIDKEVYCFGKFKNGSHALRKVRVDAVALAKDGTRLDHAWKPFARLDPGETFEVRFRFFVDPSEMHEYLVGATEAQYVE